MRTIAVAAALALSLTPPALAQEVAASAVSCHFVARVYLNFNTLTAEVAGYITDIPGITDSLFNGSPLSEQNAFLTFRSDLVHLTPVNPNGVVNLFHVSAGNFNVYFNAHPNNDWSNPNSFSNGLPFDKSNPVVSLMRDQSLFFATDTLARHDVTEHLISSQPFVLPSNGHQYDLGTFVPAGFTLYETYSNTSVGTPIPGFPSGTLPGAGNCAAVAATAAEGENQNQQ